MHVCTNIGCLKKFTRSALQQLSIMMGCMLKESKSVVLQVWPKQFAVSPIMMGYIWLKDS